jgi:hypothetical protein
MLRQPLLFFRLANASTALQLIFCDIKQIAVYQGLWTTQGQSVIPRAKEILVLDLPVDTIRIPIPIANGHRTANTTEAKAQAIQLHLSPSHSIHHSSPNTTMNSTNQCSHCIWICRRAYFWTSWETQKSKEDGRAS